MDNITITLQLLSIEGVGRVAVKSLLDQYGNLEKVFRASPEEISSITGLGIRKSKEILMLQDGREKDAPTVISRVKNLGYEVICYGDNLYPALLAQIYDPPVLLYTRGKISEVDFNAVGIVGTRKASQYGRNAARQIAKKLAANNITIVSGCALGVDAEAHLGALEGGGRTIAVLGSGLNIKYPRENAGLMDRIAENGAVISEYPPDIGPVSYNFPQRNRIISGLSMGVVVVEAPVKSGALITAYQALDQGREVYAVPGSIFSFKSKGCIDLIKKGAIPVTDGDDIIDDLGHLFNRDLLDYREQEFCSENISQSEKIILDVLKEEPLYIDMISVKTGIDIKVLAKELTSLEMMGRIEQVSGKIYMKYGK